MNSILEGILSNQTPIFLFLFALNLVLIGLVAKLFVNAKKLNHRLKELLETPKGTNIEDLLKSHLSELKDINTDLTSAKGRIDTLETKINVAKRHMGLVRYDAFEDVGGNQSFVLAIYDDNGDGAIVTSVVGRSECRVYCKPITHGKSERHLTEEEQQAILEAVSKKKKGILSY